MNGSVQNGVGVRVAYVCADSGVPIFGRKGNSVHVREVIRALRQEGATVEFFGSHCRGETPADLRTLRLHALPELDRLRKDGCEEPDPAMAEVALERVRAAGGFDFVYERYALWSSVGARWVREERAPLLVEVNAPLIAEHLAHRGSLDRARAEGLARETFTAATSLLAVSDEIAAYLADFPEARGKIHVVPNGVNPARFVVNERDENPKSPGDRRHPFTVGFIGTLKPWHGVEGLLSAFDSFHRAVPDSRLLLVGDGPKRAELEGQAAALGIQGAVVFTGAVDHEAVPVWLREMDVAVAPYPALPGFYFSPLKVFEYMAAGRAVLASETGQLRTVIEDGLTGILFPPGDTSALACALHRVHADDALRARLGVAGRAKVLRDHTWRSVALKILELARQKKESGAGT